MEMILTNGNRVKVSLKEIREFITEMCCPIPNPYWRWSELLTEQEVMGFLKGESTRDELEKVARYMLIYTENLSFTAYLFDKADGEPERTKQFNMPAVKKLRELYQKVKDNSANHANAVNLVYEMENICMEMGVEPVST